MLENMILTLYSYLVARVGFICREHSSDVTRQVETPAFLSHDITFMSCRRFIMPKLSVWLVMKY